MSHDGEALADELDARLADADAALASQYRGDRGRRQPVHTVYVPADRYDSTTVSNWARQASEAVDADGAFADVLADALDLRPETVADVADRVRRKLNTEAIEDLRIDFEDGYGTRPDEDEDAAAVAAATDLAASISSGTAAPF
ncbi:MAG TPA: aldolase, partial [Mycobacterium sp.]|nr:aldolase [Mycobacterium sp.]